MEETEKPKKRPDEDEKDFDDLSSELDDAFDALFGDEDEEIIELTDKVQPTGDHFDVGDDTIMVMPEDLAESGLLDEDMDEDDDEDIIELTDLVNPAEYDSAQLHEDDYEEIIDLIEKVAPVEHTIVGEDTLGTLKELLPESSESETEPESIIRLTDILDGGHPADGIRMDVDEALLSEEMDTATDNTAGSIGIELDELTARSDSSGNQIEAAVERYILRKYGPAIEEMIAKVVEQKVSREIEKMKRGVLDDDAE
jgi:hypothetical protein